jgi:hypothetical protein
MAQLARVEESQRQDATRVARRENDCNRAAPGGCGQPERADGPAEDHNHEEGQGCVGRATASSRRFESRTDGTRRRGGGRGDSVRALRSGTAHRGGDGQDAWDGGGEILAQRVADRPGHRGEHTMGLEVGAAQLHRKQRCEGGLSRINHRRTAQGVRTGQTMAGAGRVPQDRRLRPAAAGDQLRARRRRPVQPVASAELRVPVPVPVPAPE